LRQDAPASPIAHPAQGDHYPATTRSGGRSSSMRKEEPDKNKTNENWLVDVAEIAARVRSAITRKRPQALLPNPGEGGIFSPEPGGNLGRTTPGRDIESRPTPMPLATGSKFRVYSIARGEWSPLLNRSVDRGDPGLARSPTAPVHRDGGSAGRDALGGLSQGSLPLDEALKVAARSATASRRLTSAASFTGT
jgi:hypothetical protein